MSKNVPAVRLVDRDEAPELPELSDEFRLATELAGAARGALRGELSASGWNQRSRPASSTAADRSGVHNIYGGPDDVHLALLRRAW